MIDDSDRTELEKDVLGDMSGGFGDTGGREPQSSDVNGGGRDAESTKDGYSESAESEEKQESANGGGDPPDPDKTGEPPFDPDDAKRHGDATGQAIAWLPIASGKFLLGILMGILSKLPKKADMYRWMIRSGYEGLYKNTDAHVIANTIYGDGTVVPRAAEVDEEEQKLQTKNDEWWTISSGLNTVRIGDAVVVTGVADHHELVDHVQARIAESVDLGPRRYQTVEETPDGYEPVQVATSQQQQAVGDGGQMQLRQSTTFDDIWVDTRNPERDSDGWIVSMEKAYELHWDRGSSEEMENQEIRGRLAEMDPEDHKRQALYYALIGLGGVALGMFGPSLATQIAGGTADAGGSALPMFAETVSQVI